jgi:hypothetical protein
MKDDTCQIPTRNTSTHPHRGSVAAGYGDSVFPSPYRCINNTGKEPVQQHRQDIGYRQW